jgi:hypothetical protein
VGEQGQTAPSIMPDSSIARSELLQLLDSEIALIVEERNREGWTSWAVLGGLGTLSWLLWESLIKDPFVWENVLSIYLGLSLLYFSFVFAKQGIVNPSEKAPRQRFRYIDLYLFSTSIVGLPFAAVLIWLALRLSAKVPLWIEIWTVLLLTLYICILVLIICLSYLRIPVPAFARPNIRVSLVWCGVALSFVASAYFYAGHLNNPTLYDAKVAGLLFATGDLIGRLNRTKDAASLRSFVNIRRQMVIGELDMVEARRQTDMVLTGMRASDVVRSDIEDHLEGVALLNDYLREEQEILDDLLDRLSKVEKPIPDGIKAPARNLLRVCGEYKELFQKKVELDMVKLEKLKKRAHWFSGNSLDREETQRNWEMALQVVVDMAKKRGEINEKYGKVEEILREQS